LNNRTQDHHIKVSNENVAIPRQPWISSTRRLPFISSFANLDILSYASRVFNLCALQTSDLRINRYTFI
jgi:hypothetical protein